MRIYMAGPLFTAAEIEFNRRLCEQLRLYGHDVFLPQEQDQSDTDLGNIFRSDVAGIDWCQMVLGNLDGANSDSGTCWELGYGYAKNKFTMVYRTDFRVGKVDIVNLMMTESANVVILMPFKSVQELAEQIDRDIRDRWPSAQPYQPLMTPPRVFTDDDDAFNIPAFDKPGPYEPRGDCNPVFVKPSIGFDNAYEPPPRTTPVYTHEDK
jgi:nucleoside 2-deoxyribosyltransferase